MSKADLWGRVARITPAFCVTACLLTGPALAQSSFGGSFDSGTFNTTPNAAPAPAPNTGGGFGGSFDGGGAPNPAPSPNTQPAPGGDGFGPGSFNNDIVTPPAQPAPPPPPPALQQVNVDPQILAFESRDFGVPQTNQLRSGQMHGPTPTQVPGAQVVGTQGLATAIASGMEMVLIDVLGGDYSLPRALSAPALASGGQIGDRVQQQASHWLDKITGGQREMPIVIFCSDPQCWLSYNATLRTAAAGYTNVYWYRGGLQAWQMAGLQMAPAGL